MKQGVLVPDDLITSIVIKKISNAKNGFILDGFPRNIHQAESLDKVLTVDHVFFIKVDDDVIIDRLSNRLTCRACHNTFRKSEVMDNTCPVCHSDKLYIREDDREAVIKKRLEIYYKETYPLVEYYRKKAILITIDGNDDIFTINTNINNKIKITPVNKK